MRLTYLSPAYVNALEANGYKFDNSEPLRDFTDTLREILSRGDMSVIQKQSDFISNIKPFSDLKFENAPYTVKADVIQTLAMLFPDKVAAGLGDFAKHLNSIRVVGTCDGNIVLVDKPCEQTGGLAEKALIALGGHQLYKDLLKSELWHQFRITR